ncbi:hypothetical protein [Bifidobacterium tibiigranuli]|uniref:Phage tail protein n=1 Tax=Bifidobacterium tibiigranuli TaxID=2172043 RepID=A0A5N6RYA0_9BIFI|nr:hypothetical protein [Bifidobacterium tibiigranuli]KAE8127295.1 hypothetical protein DDF78_08715 [Bifidobacterium tibiigranuli]KAE8129686.1 hypothetical protein DDE84_02495 [Bifidobacterium tibiigranuli]
MTADSQGNDLSKVEVPITGAISLVPYSDANKITRTMIARSKAKPELPDAYAPAKACVGLITSDGGPQDGRDADDPTEFYQSGYLLQPEPKLTTAFTAAEDNDLTRLITVGEPDADGVYAVDDILRDDKWMAYQEEALRGGRVRRRAGVVQVTGNEPGQSERGSVKGRALTVTWQPDPNYDGHRYFESIYDPTSPAPTPEP